MAVTTPLWVVKTRLVLHQEKKTMERGLILRIGSDMFKNEGIKSFFRGFVPSIFLVNYGVI